MFDSVTLHDRDFYAWTLWRNTIDMQRFDLKEFLEENPTLVNKLNERMERAYSKSILLAVRETGLSKQMFPPLCPFNAEQLLSEDYWPEQRIIQLEWRAAPGWFDDCYTQVKISC